MKCNVGPVDRAVRIILALLLAGAGYYTGMWWLYIIALVPLLTGLVGYCALYPLLGVNTCESGAKE